MTLKQLLHCGSDFSSYSLIFLFFWQVFHLAYFSLFHLQNRGGKKLQAGSRYRSFDEGLGLLMMLAKDGLTGDVSEGGNLGRSCHNQCKDKKGANLDD